ncbi:hypothetical protein ACFY36_43345 [Actinoplanes sp. NPDC000266]
MIVTCTIVAELEGGEPEPAPILTGGPFLNSPRVPRATRLATGGVPGCVRGPARPVVGTTTPALSAVFVAPAPFEVIFEQQAFGETGSVVSATTGVPGEPVVLESPERGFAPGESWCWTRSPRSTWSARTRRS